MVRLRVPVSCTLKNNSSSPARELSALGRLSTNTKTSPASVNFTACATENVIQRRVWSERDDLQSVDIQKGAQSLELDRATCAGQGWKLKSFKNFTFPYLRVGKTSNMVLDQHGQPIAKTDDQKKRPSMFANTRINQQTEPCNARL